MISPILSIVADWRKSTPPSAKDIPKLRLDLLTAALQELEQCLNNNTAYNPLRDARFLWASNYLDHHENKSIDIDTDLEFTIHLMLDDPIFSHKHIAANDH